MPTNLRYCLLSPVAALGPASALLYSSQHTIMIRAVLFDLDETLFDRTNAVITCIRGQYNRFSVIAERASQDEFLNCFVALDQHGYAKREIIYEQLLDTFGLPQSLHPELIADWHVHYLIQGSGFAGMHEVLRMLKTAGYSLGLVTNGSTKTQQGKIDQLAIGQYFTAIVISDTFGVRKPDPRIFQHALAELGARADETVFVGDNPTVDIEGAQAVGMHAIWKRDAYWGHAPTADAVINDLLELPTLIHQMNQ